MRRRVVGAMVGMALVAGPVAVASGAGAQTVTPGTAVATATSTVLGVELGTDGALLGLRLLGDDSRAANTPGATEAALSPLTVTSSLVPGVALSAPVVATSSTGAADSEQVAPALPATPAVGAALTGVLTSVVDDLGARSTIDASVTNLALAGGLLSAPSVATRLGTDAGTTAAEASRTVSAPEVVVLDLGAVLDGLGRSLTDLPVADLIELLGALGLTLPAGLESLNAAGVQGAVTQLNAAIDSVQALGTGALNSTVCSQVDGVLGSIPLPPLPVVPVVPVLPVVPGDPVVPVPTPPTTLSCTDVTATVSSVLDQLQDRLSALLAQLLSVLDGAALLTIRDINVGLVTQAAETVGKSFADVTGRVGSVEVGATVLPTLSGLDLVAGVDAINALATTVETAVGGVLATVDPSLAGIVAVDLLEITKGVRIDGADTVAEAAVVALRATITPPTGVLSAAADVTTVGSEITALGGTVPAMSAGTAALETALGGVQALSGPSTVTVADLGAASRFRPGTQVLAAQTGTLPRTGAETDHLVAYAAMLICGGMALVVGVRRRLS